MPFLTTESKTTCVISHSGEILCVSFLSSHPYFWLGVVHVTHLFNFLCCICFFLFVSFSVLCPVLIACVTWLSNLICFIPCSVPSVDCVCHVIVQSYLFHSVFCAQCWLRVSRDCPILFVSFSVLCPVLIACVTWLSNLICLIGFF
jgi:hypothetical protein